MAKRKIISSFLIIIAFLSMALVSGCNLLNAEIKPGTISGTVVHLLTEEKFTSGTIQIQGTDVSTSINSNGAYRLENVPAGSHTLTITSEGKTYRAYATVQPLQDVTLDIRALNGDLVTIEDFEGIFNFDYSGQILDPAASVSVTSDAKQGSKAGLFTFPAWAGWSVLQAWPQDMAVKMSKINPTHIAFWVKCVSIPTGEAAIKIRLSSGQKFWFASTAISGDTWTVKVIPITEFDDNEWGAGNILTTEEAKTLNGFSIAAQWPNEQEIQYIVDNIQAVQIDE